MRPETGPWWRQAQADLETASLLWDAGRHYAVSWFAQQAAEKGLKALYIERKAALPPRTHHLEYLGTELSVPETVQSDLALLNPAFELVRYPNPATGQPPVDGITAELAGPHVEAAGRVLEWVRECLT